MKRSCGRTVVSILFMEACMATEYRQTLESILLPLAYDAEHQSFATTIRPLVSSPDHRTDSERKRRTESCTEPETCNGRILLTTLALRQFTPEKKRIKISLIIIRIKILMALKKTHYPIRKRCSNHLIDNFENPLCKDGLQHQRRRNNSPKSNADKNHGIQPFTYER